MNLEIFPDLITLARHPRFVHFPIALFISAIGIDILSLIFRKESLHRTALHVYILATVSTPFVVLSGLFEADRLHLNHPILNLHKNFALWTMGLSLVSLPILFVVKKWNPKAFRLLFMTTMLLIVFFVSITAHQGGRMVYEYGVGVDDI